MQQALIIVFEINGTKRSFKMFYFLPFCFWTFKSLARKARSIYWDITLQNSRMDLKIPHSKFRGWGLDMFPKFLVGWGSIKSWKIPNREACSLDGFYCNLNNKFFGNFPAGPILFPLSPYFSPPVCNQFLRSKIP